MSAPEPAASSTTPDLTQDPPFIKFPPFPGPPPGVTIMPFRDFKPRGIQLFSEPKKGGEEFVADEDDAELDALGIPTIELRVKHTTDECKSSPRKKRKKRKAALKSETAVPAKKLPWYEDWVQGEDLRVTKERYDPRISPADRLFQCASDFRTGRPWPPITSGLNNLWDQFRLFTGLLVNPSLFRKAGAKKYAHADSPDFESDEEDDPCVSTWSRADAGDARPAKPQQSGNVDDVDGALDDPQKLDEEVREEKVSIFLSDPEKAVRIFLSSYMREHGLIWAERNLINMPRLISFFLAFVLRNRVLPEPAYQRGLKRALEAIEWAKKELPLTYKVGQSIPDTFNEACRECFGRQGGMNWSIVDASPITREQKDANIPVTDVSSGATRNVVLPTEAEVQIKEAIEDNIDMENSTVLPSAALPLVNEDFTENAGGRGNASGNEWTNGWDDEGSQNAWGQGGSWGDEPLDGQGTNGEAENDSETVINWGSSNPSWNHGHNVKALFSLLGPTAFPLTHTTGIVECSTRRVSAICFPPNYPKGAPLSTCWEDLGKATAGAGAGEHWAPSAQGVEAELDAHFAKVILEPWSREEGDISRPEIWNTSRGPVIDPKSPCKTFAETGTTARKPHDPLTDKITLLVQPSLAETLALVPGLGLGAMWIEIVRQKNGAGTGALDGVAQVDDDTPVRFWYHEDVTGIFPSFYTPRMEE